MAEETSDVASGAESPADEASPRTAVGADGVTYEEVDVDFSEGEIEAYLVDEDDNEIGFVVLDEDGNEVEYYYVDDEGEADGGNEADADGGAAAGEDDNPYDLGITREGVADATKDMNDIYHDGAAIAAELKGAFDDIREALDFSDLMGKKK